MQINFHSLLWSNLPRVLIFLAMTVYRPALIASNVDGLQIIYSPVMELSKGICPIYSDANYIKKKIKKKRLWGNKSWIIR